MPSIDHWPNTSTVTYIHTIVSVIDSHGNNTVCSTAGHMQSIYCASQGSDSTKTFYLSVSAIPSRCKSVWPISAHDRCRRMSSHSLPVSRCDMTRPTSPATICRRHNRWLAQSRYTNIAEMRWRIGANRRHNVVWKLYRTQKDLADDGAGNLEDRQKVIIADRFCRHRWSICRTVYVREMFYELLDKPAHRAVWETDYLRYTGQS